MKCPKELKTLCDELNDNIEGWVDSDDYIMIDEKLSKIEEALKKTKLDFLDPLIRNKK